MTRHPSSAGQGKIGCILWTLLLLVGGMVAWKVIPVKIAAAELHDFMVEQAKFGAGSTAEVVRARILNKARQLALPVAKEDISVQKGGGRIRMTAAFTVPVEFPGYVYYWDFDLEVDRPIFIF